MERVTKNLNAAIATMRAACDDAERRAKDGNSYSVQSVLHALAWGMANATSSIECVMAAVEDEHDKHAYMQAQAEEAPRLDRGAQLNGEPKPRRGEVMNDNTTPPAKATTAHVIANARLIAAAPNLLAALETMDETDRAKLSVYWVRHRVEIDEIMDDAMAGAQDHAYALGVARCATMCDDYADALEKLVSAGGGLIGDENAIGCARALAGRMRA